MTLLPWALRCECPERHPPRYEELVKSNGSEGGFITLIRALLACPTCVQGGLGVMADPKEGMGDTRRASKKAVPGCVASGRTRGLCVWCVW